MKPYLSARAALAALLALCLLLGGCSTMSVLPQGGGGQADLPEPESAGLAPAIGEETAGYACEVRLYYPTLDGRGLAPVTRPVSVPGDRTLGGQVLELLLAETPAGLSPALPEGTQLLSLVISCGIATVNLSLSAPADEQTVLGMQASIANTLTSLPGVEAVNLLLDGRKIALRGLSAGLTRLNENNLSAQWSQLLADEELMSAASVTREAAVYYPGAEGLYLAPQICTVTLSGGNPLGDLLDFLSQAPDSGCLRAALPQPELLSEPPKLLTTASGERVVKVVLDANRMALLEQSGLSPWQLYAALTLTLTGFVPELDGVCVYIGEGLALKTASPAGEISFPGGVMRRSDFERFVGEQLTVYLTAGDGSLAPCKRLIPAGDAPASAKTRIEITLAGPADWENAVSAVAPEGIGPEDLLGVRIADGQAVANFSERFYQACAGLDAGQERNLAYSLVQTLCDLPSVRSVRLQREGMETEYLGSSIYLRSALIPNTGLLTGSAQASGLVAP